MERRLHINELPNEVLQMIFAFLPRLKERSTLSLVCPRWDDLAFDARFLNRIQLRLGRAHSRFRYHKVSRRYRTLVIGTGYFCSFCEGEMDIILSVATQLGPVLEELVSGVLSTKVLLKILSKSPRLKKVKLYRLKDCPLPILRDLEELEIVDGAHTDIVRLAPNLRKLCVHSNLHFARAVIEELPLEHLACNLPMNDNHHFRYLSKETKLTTVVLFNSVIVQEDLVQLCKSCPLLIKLWLNTKEITSLHCLATLKHLKLISLEIEGTLNTESDLVLPNIKMLVLCTDRPLHLSDDMRRVFPSVQFLRLNALRISYSQEFQIGEAFPRLIRLELNSLIYDKHLELIIEKLTQLAMLRELVVGVVTFKELPIRSRQQLKRSKVAYFSKMIDLFDSF